MRKKGKTTTWKGEKGFGFITPNDGGKQIFFHIKAFRIQKKPPVINQIVTYTLSTDKQGRRCAEQVTGAGEISSRNNTRKSNIFAFIAPLLFVFIVGVSAFTNKIALLMFPFYLAVSLFTFILYAVDKSAAKNGSWRTQESTLHFFALAGGWPGAMIAQQTLRHKSKKQSFRTVFWVTVIVNIGLFAWIHTPEGGAILSLIFDTV